MPVLIIAANVASARFIVGRKKETGVVNPNNIVVPLLRDSEEVNDGKGSDVLGDQWEAALWLVKNVVQQGWDIEPGHILLTGALGNMIPGKPGIYEDDFVNLGKIFFSIN